MVWTREEVPGFLFSNEQTSIRFEMGERGREVESRPDSIHIRF